MNKKINESKFNLEDAAQAIYEKAEEYYKGSEINADTLSQVMEKDFHYSARQQRLLDEYFKQQEELNCDIENIEEAKSTNDWIELQEAINHSNKIEIKTGLSDTKAGDILNSVIGQLSDGIWENSSAMERYRRSVEVDKAGSEYVLIFYLNDTTDSKSHLIKNPFKDKSEADLKKWFANKIKQIIKEENLEWSRNNTAESSYLNHGKDVTVQDAYRVYDQLLGRKSRIEENKSYKELKESKISENDLGKIVHIDKIISNIQSKYNVQVTGAYTDNSIILEFKGDLLQALDAIEYTQSSIDKSVCEFHLGERNKDKITCTIIGK